MRRDRTALRPTPGQLQTARNILVRLVNYGGLSARDVRRAQDGIAVLEDSFWSRVEKPDRDDGDPCTDTPAGTGASEGHP